MTSDDVTDAGTFILMKVIGKSSAKILANLSGPSAGCVSGVNVIFLTWSSPMKWTEDLTGNVLWFAFVVFMLWKPLNAIYRTTVLKNQGQNSPGIVLPRNYVGWETWPRPDYNRGMESPFGPAERRGSMAAEILKRGPRE